MPSYKFNPKLPIGHSEKSVILILQNGLYLNDQEILAINAHMGGFDARVLGGSRDIGNTFDLSILAVELHIADLRSSYICENKKMLI